MIKKIILKDFRSFKNIDISFNKNIVVFVGDNGTGKTSLLEAIYITSTTKSYKTKDANVISFNKPFCKISIKENKNYKIVITPINKKVFINNNEIKKLGDFIGNMRVVLFSPEDMNIVFGPPQIRRMFMDINLSQTSKKYINALNRYKKILKQRNELLKNIQKDEDLTFLDIITKQLIEESKIIISERSEFIDKINKEVLYIDEKEKMNIIYKPSIIKEDLTKIFNEKKQYDILTKTTNQGVHRDDLLFYINDIEASYFSQGQNRSIVLQVKMALIKYIFKKTNEKPIVLFDDVLSELDSKRQNKLFEVLDFDYQVFITTTNISRIKNNIIDKAQIFFLSKEGVRENE